MLRAAFFITCLALVAPAAHAQTQPQAQPGIEPQIEPRADAPVPELFEGPMSVERMVALVTMIDPEAEVGPGSIFLSLDDVPVTIVYDAGANRMRALVPIASADTMDEGQMLRLLQANFDTTLDARYAIAQGRVWSVFVHPLAELQARQFMSGLAQTVALAHSYGTTFASTEMIFERGDSASRLRELAEPDTDL